MDTRRGGALRGHGRSTGQRNADRNALSGGEGGEHLASRTTTSISSSPGSHDSGQQAQCLSAETHSDPQEDEEEVEAGSTNTSKRGDTHIHLSHILPILYSYLYSIVRCYCSLYNLLLHINTVLHYLHNIIVVI